MGQITIDEMHKSLFDYAQAVSDENLITESKTVVGAINEIYGKKLIANAIGEPLNNTDTYSKMSSDINSLLSTFKTNMMNAGVAVESNDKFKSLIEKIKGLTEGEGNKGIQYTKLTGQWEIQSNQSTGNKTISIPLGLDFTPSIIICYFPTYAAYGFGGGAYFYNLSGQQNVIVANNIPYINAQNSNSKMEITNISSESISISNGFYTPDGERYYFLGGICTEIYAIGVGEEDTTIESSIISILKSKGYDESKDNIIDFIENKLYTKVIEPGTNVTIATGEGLESRRSENNQLFTKSLIVPSLSNLGSDNIKGLSLKVVSWAYHDDLYGPEQYSMSDGYFRIQIKRDGVVINNAFESSAYTYNYNNGNGTTHAYNLLDVQEGDVIEYTVGYYASGFLGTNVHEYHFGVKGAYLTYSIGYVTSL